MMRTEIWQKCDPARCNAVPGVLNTDFSLEDYAEYILGTPAIVGFDENGDAFATEKTFGELYSDRAMTLADVEHSLSLFFNDARLKTYIEIRPADSMPIPHAAAYATLIKGLFYYEKSLDILDELVEGVTESAVEDAKNSLMKYGYDGEAFGHPASELVDALFDTAKSSLPRVEGGFMNPLLQLARMRKTLAMMAERK